MSARPAPTPIVSRSQRSCEILFDGDIASERRRWVKTASDTLLAPPANVVKTLL